MVQFKGENMKIKLIFSLFFAALLISCASVPKESVDLSATVGRDLVVAHKAHRHLAEILFDRMKSDINRFIDDVYAPHQISAVMVRQKELADSTNPALRNKSLLLAINKAFSEEGSPELQRKVLLGMEKMVLAIQKDIENTRSELLDPIQAQENEAIDSIDRAYNQLQYANAVVTGHLASIKKVHDAQSEIMAEIGIERDLRTEVGQHIADASAKVGEIIASAESYPQKMADITKKVEEIKSTIDDLKFKLHKD